MARFREPFRSVLDDFRIRFEAISIRVYLFLECFLDPQKSINCIENHRFVDHFWILFGSFWDHFWRRTPFCSALVWIFWIVFGVQKSINPITLARVFGSFWDAFWSRTPSGSALVWIFLDFFGAQKSINTITLARFLDPFWIVLESFWDRFRCVLK